MSDVSVEPVAEAGKKKQSFLDRIIKFMAGGIFSYSGNIAILGLLTDGIKWPAFICKFTGLAPAISSGLGWSLDTAYSLSLAIVTLASFVWSYYVNFRTGHAWQDCAPRYISVVAFCYFVNRFCVNHLNDYIPDRIKLLILFVTISVSLLKFLLYHFWVFPHKK